MGGSEQFLGQQLTKQANALQTLVEKMSEMIAKQDEIIPKFAEASEELKNEAVLNITNSGTTTNDILIKSLGAFLNGQIRLKLYWKPSVGSGNYKVAVNKNGIEVASHEFTNEDTNLKESIFDITVVEGDSIEIYRRALMNGNGTFNKLQVFYTLIDKPNISL